MTSPHGIPGTIDAGILHHLHDFVHGWFPHSSALIDALSVLIAVGAGLAVFSQNWWTKREKPLERAFRVAFAAGPIPVFVVMPFIPYDNDLAAMLLDERWLLFLSAGVGLIWTIREIFNAFRE